MSKSLLVIDTPNTCGDCPLCIYTKEEKKYIGYCNTSDEDYYCKALDRFMEYDKVDGGIDILGKAIDCPLKSTDGLIKKIVNSPSDVGQNMYKTKYDGAARRQNEIIEIIKEYCEHK